MTKFYAVLFLIFFSCNSRNQEKEKYYMHIDGRDTSVLRLLIYDNRFYGEVTHTKGGVAPVVGKINGDIKGDTLIGDYHYKPYKWKEKKRLPIALLKQGDSYIEGNGQMIDLMGILTYIERTIKFDTPKRVYQLVNSK